ncbi:serine hydrolase [Compostibacter hankyongensis]
MYSSISIRRAAGLLTAFLFFLPALPALSQHLRTDKRLQQQLQEWISDFHGTAGIYVHNLRTGRMAAVNADTVFPTASIIKVPILVGIFDQIRQGKLKYHQPLLYRDSLSRGGSGVMGFFKDSTKTDLSTAVSLMIGYSDNTAALWCQGLAGGGTVINQWLAAHGFVHTRVNSRTPGRDSAWRQYGWGQTSPREMATLFTLIREGKAVSPAASERMYRLMTHIYWDEYALSAIPPYIQTASKQGMVDASRSEGVLVNAPHGDYVFYIATKNNRDQSWKPDNEAWQLARKVAAYLWHYYEPRSTWQPASGSDAYREDAGD